MTLAQEYFLLVFMAAAGCIQVAAGHAGLRGLLLSQRRRVNLVLSGLLLAPSMFVLFTWNTRNPVGIIEGAEQAGLFSLSVLATVAATLLVSSLLNHRALKPVGRPGTGLEAMKEFTFFQAIRARYFWTR
jgi:hypothetical protein